ncbi:MAG: autotransporter domain-containing protein [Bdellovibrionia bacterium]
MSRILLFFSAIFLSAQLFAAPSQVANESSAPTKLTAESGFSKNVSLVVQPGGFGPNLIWNQGLALGVEVTPDSRIELEAMNGTQVLDSIFFGKYDVHSIGAGLHYKKFAWHSLYVKGGLTYRRLNHSKRYDNHFFTGKSVIQKFEGDVFAADVGVGNQWQWGHFTMGVDWVGFSLPVSSRVTSERVEGEMQVDRVALQPDEDAYLKRGSLTALNLYLGASW